MHIIISKIEIFELIIDIDNSFFLKSMNPVNKNIIFGKELIEPTISNLNKYIIP